MAAEPSVSRVDIMRSEEAGPTWWKRQAGLTGATYSDATLVENFAGSWKPAEFRESKNAESEPHPETFSIGKYGLMISSHHEQHVKAYEKHTKVSQADWVSQILK